MESLKIQAQIKKLKTLLNVCCLLSSTRKLNNVLNYILTLLKEYLGVERCSIALVEEGGKNSDGSTKNL